MIFGGSFDPPTRAHLSLSLEARDRLGAEWILFVPAARSPLKDDGPEADGPDRVAMLVAGLRGVERAAVSTIELDRAPDGPSYTIDTLRQLRGLLGSRASLRLLIGADQARAFHRWRQPREVIALAEPVVMTRAGVAEAWAEIAGSMRGNWTREELEAWRSRLIQVTPVEGSASEARALLRAGNLNSLRLKQVLTPEVLAVIGERDLYRGLGD